MFTVYFEDEMLDKIKALLEDEDESVAIRLKEYKIGAG